MKSIFQKPAEPTPADLIEPLIAARAKITPAALRRVREIKRRHKAGCVLTGKEREFLVSLRSVLDANLKPSIRPRLC